MFPISPLLVLLLYDISLFVAFFFSLLLNLIWKTSCVHCTEKVQYCTIYRQSTQRFPFEVPSVKVDNGKTTKLT